mmetsp:Transcript_30105/g.105824  ORF Transcript_30105/g.105824 Transcript_30105/m.105824 type:complete len:82 (-) Transcript_30105:41-286(-)
MALRKFVDAVLHEPLRLFALSHDAVGGEGHLRRVAAFDASVFLQRQPPQSHAFYGQIFETQFFAEALHGACHGRRDDSRRP